MKTKPKSWVLKVFNIMLIGAIVFFGINIFQRISDTIQYTRQKKAQEQEITKLKKQEAELKEEKSRLENPEYILRYARGKYLLSGEGETIIKLPSKGE